MEKVIKTPEEVTPTWLTGVLRESDFLRRGKVISVKVKLTKTLMVSVVSRLEVSYSLDAPASAPAKLFLKLSRPNLSQAISSELNSKEVEFYRTIPCEMVAPPFIRCYDASYSSESDSSHLLLDDLSETHFQPESSLPPSKLYCELAVECLAQLHAHWWEHPQLGKKIGKLFDESKLNAFVGKVEENVTSFIAFLGDDLSAKRRKIYDRLLSSKHKIWGRLTDATGLTVTHGDAHWWNLLYPRDMDKHRVCLFDWQLWHVDVGARDLAFMVALGGYSQRRAAMEENLIRHYYDSLIKYGVKNFTWDDCWNDYRWSAIRNLNVPVIQWSEGRSAGLWQGNLERAMLAYEDLRCSELLSD
jgi:Ecdysteroid kinase-like family